MSKDWSQFVGALVGNTYRLGEMLGSSDSHATYGVESPDGHALVVKIMPTNPATSMRLGRWQTAAGFAHPNIVRLIGAGEARVGGQDMVYVAMERGDEVLAEILHERKLTEDETRQMLPPLMDALDYLHSRGFAHGSLKASNVMAQEDTLKISSDGIVPFGEASAAGDLYALGSLMVEALTGKVPVAGADLPGGVPPGLRPVAAGCLQLDARHRWTTAQVRSALLTGVPGAVTAPRFGSRKGLIAAGAVIVIAAVLGPMFRDSEVAPIVNEPPKEVVPQEVVMDQPVEAPPPVKKLTPAEERKAKREAKREAEAKAKAEAKAAADAKAAAKNVEEPRPSPVGPKTGSVPPEIAKQVPKLPPAPTPEAAGTAEASVVHSATPEVASNALATIRGTVRTAIRAEVDASGNVTSTSVENNGGSSYFSQIALRTAKDWKFAPGAPGSWVLRFNFRSSGIETSASKR